MTFQKLTLTAAILLATAQWPILAEEPAAAESSISLKPYGVVMVDGGLYISPEKSMFPDGVTLGDARLGAEMKYEDWSAHVEVAFTNNKVGLKDVWMQYTWNPDNFLRIGNMIQQFGYQTSSGSASKITMEEPMASRIFTEPQILGVMMVHSCPHYYIATSANVELKSTSMVLNDNELAREGYGLRARMVWRPVQEGSKAAQIGISGAFLTPTYSGHPDTHDSFTLGTNFPTRVASVQAFNCVVDKAMNAWKFTPELMLCYDRIALESQYFFQQINRRENLHNYRASGAYATLRGLLKGPNYTYSPKVAGIATPSRGALECALCYSYTNLSDKKAGIFGSTATGIYGGRCNEFTATMSYYINKYMVARLHYAFEHTWDRAGFAPVTVSNIAARLQIVF